MPDWQQGQPISTQTPSSTGFLMDVLMVEVPQYHELGNTCVCGRVPCVDGEGDMMLA